MKTIFRSILFIPLLAGLTLGAASCSDDDGPVGPTANMVAKAFVYDSPNQDGADSCELYIVYEGTISNSEIVSVTKEGAYYLHATLSMTAGSGVTIPAGTYNAAKSGNVPFTFVHGAGSIAEDDLNGTYYCSIDKSGAKNISLLNSGSVVIGKSGEYYTVSYTYVENGKQIKVNYTGPIEFIQKRKQVAKAFVYPDKSGRGSDSCDLYIVGGGEIDNNRKVTGMEEGDYYLCASLNITSNSNPTIPTGAYKFVYGDFKPFTFNAGIGDVSQANLRGTYYGITDNLLMLRITHFSQGTINISSKGDTYNVTLNYAKDGNIFRINYEGPIEFVEK